MLARIFSHEKLIGTTELKIGDSSMGHIYGELSPNENYYNCVQGTVGRFWLTNKPDYIEWHSLRINIQLANGCFLFATGGFTIDDQAGSSDDPIQIHAAGVDRHIIEDFFLTDPPKTFIVEPWEDVSVEQKISFEDELKKEIGFQGNGGSLLHFFKPKHANHILLNAEFAVVCKYGPNDDVLFRIKKQDIENDFAVVHLTWRRSQEDPAYPRVKFFRSFDDFKYFRMYPDKAEWEY